MEPEAPAEPEAPTTEGGSSSEDSSSSEPSPTTEEEQRGRVWNYEQAICGHCGNAYGAEDNVGLDMCRSCYETFQAQEGDSSSSSSEGEAVEPASPSGDAAIRTAFTQFMQAERPHTRAVFADFMSQTGIRDRQSVPVSASVAQRGMCNQFFNSYEAFLREQAATIPEPEASSAVTPTTLPS
eukprot:COSAG01_NODE_33029_length_571_cov_0.983051_1_plen_181_part_01